MSTIYKLVVYIDSSLTAPGDLANLAFSRKVNGVANVIWQSKQSTDFVEINNFEWEEAYQIGVTEDTHDGALISQAMDPMDIKSGEVCNWTNVANPNVIPLPTAAPAGWPGDFGTIDLDSRYKVYINASTGPGAFSAIYADTHPISGLLNRAYTVENNFQMSWETGSISDGVITEYWSDPWPFPIPKGQTIAWISWGPQFPGGTDAEWYYYVADPKKHDPSKAVIPPAMATEELDVAPISPESSSTVVNLGWEADEMLSSAGKRQYAAAFAAYLRSASHPGLNIELLEVSEKVVAATNLSMSGGFYDLLEGSTRSEKTATLIRGLIRCAGPRYTPTEQRFSTQIVPRRSPAMDGPAAGTFTAALNLVWRAVSSIGTIGLYAPASLSYIKSLVTAMAVPPNVQIDYTTVTVAPDGTTASTTIKLSGLNQVQVTGAMKEIVNLVNNEAARKTKPAGSAPPNTPTPDPVAVTTTQSMKTYRNSFGEVYQQLLVDQNELMNPRDANGHVSVPSGKHHNVKALTNGRGHTARQMNGAVSAY